MAPIELRLDEVAVQAFIAKLKNGWAARATAINAEKAAGSIFPDVMISAPSSEQFFVGAVEQLAKYPACFVLPSSMAFREQGAHSLMTSMQIQVWVCDSDQTGPRLATRLMRQARAVIEVMYDDVPQEGAFVSGSATVPGPYHIIPSNVRPGATFRPSRQSPTWRGSYMIVFKAEQEEN